MRTKTIMKLASQLNEDNLILLVWRAMDFAAHNGTLQMSTLRQFEEECRHLRDHSFQRRKLTA